MFEHSQQSAATVPSASLSDLYRPIERDLQLVERLFDEETLSRLPCVNEFCTRIQAYRGKMLRPALLLLAGQAVGGSLTPAHHILAAVVEMVHMATLVHDDVLDDASERRHQTTVNALSGNAAAVLLGDYLISHAYHLCSSLESQTASRLIGATTNRVCEGELLQNHHRGNTEMGEATYYHIIGLKTAALTAASCALGATWSGGDPATVAALHSYGEQAGMAFQIVDDVLDFVGHTAEVGKTLGRDLDLGKTTLPLIHCLSRIGPKPAARLRAAIRGEQRLLHEDVRGLLEEAGSLEYALSAARRHVAEAIENLEILPPGEAASSLRALAEFITQRRY